MKKTLTRVLSLLVALVLVIGAVPVALASPAEGETTNTTVSSAAATSIVLSSSDAVNVSVGATATLPTATVKNGDETVANATVTWVSIASTVANVEGATVKGVSAGSTTVKATYSYSETGADGAASVEKTVESDPITVNVAKGTITPTVQNITDLYIGKEVDLTIGGLTGLTLTEDYSISTSVKEGSSAHPDGIKVKGIKEGTTTITVTITLNDTANYQFPEGKTTWSSDISVTVKKAGLECEVSQNSLLSGSNSTVVITPTYQNVPEGVTVTFGTAVVSSSSNCSVTVSGPNTADHNTYTVSNPRGDGGLVNITIPASYVVDGETVEISSTVTLGVYVKQEVKAYVRSSSFVLSDSTAFYSVKKNGSTVVGNSISDAIVGVDGISQLSLTLDSSGKLIKNITSTSATTIGFQNIKITLNDISGSETLQYTWTTSDGIKLIEGTLTLVSEGTEADIIYTGNYSKDIEFGTTQFTSFWSKKVAAGAVSGTLKKIVFEGLSYGSMPQYGTLYTGSTKVLSDFEFTTTSQSGYYTLSSLYYRPDSSVKTAINVQIPFTAYGVNGSKAYGVIEIRLNQTQLSISTLGVRFGSGSTSVADLIAANYNANTNKTLAFVTFPDISASAGKLRYNYKTVLDSETVKSSYEYYVNPTSTQRDLDEVVFVPRAGLTGEVTIAYIGYDVGKSVEYKGTVTLSVEGKTKSTSFSDVNASSYSWAADAVDFLNNQGVANGSNGKYNPAASITRGDFMLMLYRAFLEDEYEDYNVTSNFPDVVKGTSTYSKETYQAVGVAKYLGIAQGSNGKYNPTANITREEAMTLIYRTLDKVGYSMSYTVSTSTSSFSDYSSVSSYAQAAIKDLIGHGVVVGTNGKIQPKSNITRAEMAVILHRVLTY